MARRMPAGRTRPAAFYGPIAFVEPSAGDQVTRTFAFCGTASSINNVGVVAIKKSDPTTVVPGTVLLQPAVGGDWVAYLEGLDATTTYYIVVYSLDAGDDATQAVEITTGS
jgi:hypothetical protein